MTDTHEPSRTAGSVLDDAGRSLFQLGRTFARLPMRELLETRSALGVELSTVLIVQAVQSTEFTGEECTVGFVAAQLGVDPSTASRLVGRAVQSGYLQRGASATDGRVHRLELTDTGRKLVEHALRYQRRVFAAATAGWSGEERRAFARLFVRFTDAITKAMNEERS